jgi:hypothetical protein
MLVVQQSSVVTQALVGDVNSQAAPTMQPDSAQPPTLNFFLTWYGDPPSGLGLSLPSSQ